MSGPVEPVNDLQGQVSEWIAGGERYDVEFKGERRERLNDRDLVEAVVCLTNGSGGALLVGVEDDGTATLSDREIANALGPIRADSEVTAGALLLFGHEAAP